MKIRLAIALTCTLLLSLGAVVAWGYWATQQAPEFYEEALKAEPEEQQLANDQLLENATALVSNARKEGSWQAIFTADQINGWLAVDLAQNYPEFLPAGVSDPRVMLRPGGATLACGCQDGVVNTVLSLEAEVVLTAPNVVSIRLHRARAGAIPVPLVEILDGITQAATDAGANLTWKQADGDPVAIVSFNPPRDEDDTFYQLENLELRDGEVYVAGRTTRGGSESSPVWQPEFKPVASAEPRPKENIQR